MYLCLSVFLPPPPRPCRFYSSFNILSIHTYIRFPGHYCLVSYRLYMQICLCRSLWFQSFIICCPISACHNPCTGESKQTTVELTSASCVVVVVRLSPTANPITKISCSNNSAEARNDGLSLTDQVLDVTSVSQQRKYVNFRLI